MYTISQIAFIINARQVFYASDAAVEHILTDSRKLLFASASVFFALPGPRRHGNGFVSELYEKGVRNFVVGQDFVYPQPATFTGANILQVDDVVQALQQLVAFHRSQFDIPVIGITGSNGKTIVKEWLYQLLHEDFVIVRSPKSYNSQIGVPLSVWSMNTSHTLGIFEAGISTKKEMHRLQEIIQPTIGIFTSIGEAHDEGFTNRQEKIAEKLLLFKHASLLIYNADTIVVADINACLNKQVRLFSWGMGRDNTLQILSINKFSHQTKITVSYKNQISDCLIPFTDDASIENAISCWCVLLYLAMHPQSIADRMIRLKPVEMRLELKAGINHTTIINDSYNADLNSLTIALDFLQQQQQYTKRTVILSDILQSGKSSTELYTTVATILQQKKINRLIGIGPEISKQKDCFNEIAEVVFFSSTAEFRQQFHSLHFHNETILLKGARLFEFEQIGHLLEQKVHQTFLEINLTALAHNLNIYKQQLKPGVKLMVMVKASSYGSGSFEIANLLQFHKVDYLAVAYADEGVELRKAGITLPIMVMNAEEVTFDSIVQYNLEPELFSWSILASFEKYLSQSGIVHYPVHIKLDTGMRRLGFDEQDISQLCQALVTLPAFKVQSVFSHLAASDNAAHDFFTAEQAHNFLQCVRQLQTFLPYTFLQHIANTSAIHRHKNLQMDMVRLGIGLYGVDSNPAMQQQLRKVATLKTTISQIKNVKAGQSIGYSRKGITARDSVIATVRIGYADGYPRLLSNGSGKMMVNGKLVPVIGNVCMDMTMLDITGVAVKEGDEVIVFGDELSVSDVAEWAQTIAYEILTGISNRVQRVYYEE